MAATAWSVYDSFQEQIGKGLQDLSGDTFDMHLFRGSSNAATSALSTLGSLTSEVTSANGYTTSGAIFANTDWLSTAAGTMTFNGDDRIWTATGGNISAIRFAVVVRRSSSGQLGSNRLVCRTTLSTGNFDLNSGSTLTVQVAGAGVFTMTSAD